LNGGHTLGLSQRLCAIASCTIALSLSLGYSYQSLGISRGDKCGGCIITPLNHKSILTVFVSTTIYKHHSFTKISACIQRRQKQNDIMAQLFTCRYFCALSCPFGDSLIVCIGRRAFACTATTIKNCRWF